jgi:hypothetical protein
MPGPHSPYSLPIKKLHGKGHFAGNFEVYMADLSSTYTRPAGRVARTEQEAAKNYILRQESFLGEWCGLPFGTTEFVETVIVLKN